MMPANLAAIAERMRKPALRLRRWSGLPAGNHYHLLLELENQYYIQHGYQWAAHVCLYWRFSFCILLRTVLWFFFTRLSGISFPNRSPTAGSGMSECTSVIDIQHRPHMDRMDPKAGHCETCGRLRHKLLLQ